ncbi:LuxR family transcriptional regulator [Aquimarina sp. BL5]|uniref:response regulator transcription factor n=1 Tax=Aquimarina sp. BL5 TaxID=1714860 RepID=UPI000E478F8D|nr:helix-turn-helix transcriptional regulator [Aquimarina sp. BL5]AXT52782.1 LuxR family transcriptional regulator [Aquimarina sp. BL5]RKN03738.1 LuxR family transcriptional regulator [Aquimarina sp. BL5]
MKWIKTILCISFLICSPALWSQYKFSGFIDNNTKDNTIYLSLIEDYRKMSGIYPEQIIQKVVPDSTGYFVFTENNLPSQNRIYRIHTENCSEEDKEAIHFNGICLNSKEILFIAKNQDTISLPFTVEEEVFCEVVSTNERSNTFLKVDSIIENMRYAFSSYRSEANRKVNSKKWFRTLQEYGKNQNEPLTELYIYSFLSNKSNNLYTYYLQDLKQNTYYDALLDRLKNKYPDSPYVQQYKTELAADKFSVEITSKESSSYWLWIIIALLILSGLLNVFLFQKLRKHRDSHQLTEKKLTQQERKILDLILQDKTNKEIASLLFLSVSTIKTHINNLYKKIDVESRDEAKTLYKNK